MTDPAPPKMMGYEEAVAGGVERITGQALQNHLEDHDLSRLVAAASDFAAVTVEDLIKKQPPPRPLACAAGCHFCCITTEVQAAPLEAIAIAIHVETTFDAAARDQLSAGLRAWTDAAATAAWKKDQPDAAPARRPCPLLDDAGGCSVYAVRPMVCRGFNAYDAGQCERFKAGDPDVRIKGYVHLDRVHQATLSGLVRGCRAAGREHALVDLPRALTVLLDDPEARRRWQTGDTVLADTYATVDGT